MALHRPYIRKGVRQEVERRAQKNEKDQFLDANTGQPIEGKYDMGHKTGHEYRTALAEAEEQGLSQSEFNDLQNNSDIFQIEDPSSNRSHAFEQKDQEETRSEEAIESESETAENEEETESESKAAEIEETTESESEAAEASEGVGMEM